MLACDVLLSPWGPATGWLVVIGAKGVTETLVKMPVALRTYVKPKGQRL